MAARPAVLTRLAGVCLLIGSVVAAPPASSAATTSSLGLSQSELATLAQQAYVKPAAVSSGTYFGNSVAISGNTMVVGVANDRSGIGGVENTAGSSDAQVDQTMTASGAAYVFVRSGGRWVQQAYLKAAVPDAIDNFGYTVGISGDTIVVGAPWESSNAVGVEETSGSSAAQQNDSATASGAAYVFVRSSGRWSQHSFLKPSNTGADDRFGSSVAISGDTIVVGAVSEDGSVGGVENTSGSTAAQTSDPGTFHDTGAAYVFTRSSGHWSQQAYLKASDPDQGDHYGETVAIDGDTIVVGLLGDDSSYPGPENTGGTTPGQSDGALFDSGAAFVYLRASGLWAQQAFLKASNPDQSDWFGSRVAISGDTIVVSALQEQSGTAGVENTSGSSVGQSDDSLDYAGAAYVFARTDGTWAQQAYLKASNPDMFDAFGRSIAVEGDTVVVGAPAEGSNATGIELTGGSSPAQEDDSIPYAGAAYVFGRSDGTWSQGAYVKSTNQGDDFFADPVAISGGTIVLGASDDDSSIPGLENTGGSSPAQQDNGASGAGAVYVFAGRAAAAVGFAGPYWVRSAGATTTTPLSASIAPAVAGCAVSFTLTDATGGSYGPFTTTSNTGTATAQATLPDGVYDVAVGGSGGCSGAADEGVIVIASGPGTAGTVGGGSYRSSATPPGVSFGHALRVATSTNKRTGVTTTTTSGALIWVAKAGLRLKVRFAGSTTDGTSPWTRNACPEGLYPVTASPVCGRYSGATRLESWDPSANGGHGGWRDAGPVSFVVSVYDGGTMSVCRGAGRTKQCTTTELPDSFGITVDGAALSPDPTGEPSRLLGGAINSR